MDSLTQIILGSAVAEASLGKKVGNRAMVWGAIAGTIPDLDVISNGFMSPIDALAFHRGITHSFLFEIIVAGILGYLVYYMYRYPKHKWLGIGGWSILILAISYLILVGFDFSLKGIGVSALLLAGLGFLVYRRYTRLTYDSPLDATVWDWQKMFFWSLITHPILDCFTTYGTQFLLPFSSSRISWNNIAVADPAYTLPFMICLIVAICLPKGSRSRWQWNTAGIVISSVYMIFTIINKVRVDQIFEQSLAKQQIVAKRYMTTPTILNNILWSGIAETDNAYYYGQYSLFDREKAFVLTKKDKTSIVISETFKDDSTMKTLRWFSANYYFMEYRTPDTLSYYDLRFGTFKIRPTDPDNFVFKFDLVHKGKALEMLPQDSRGPAGMNIGDAFKALWIRIKGI